MNSREVPSFKGDVTPEFRQAVTRFAMSNVRDESFASAVARRLVLTEAALYTRDKDGKAQVRLTYQVTVTPDMVNQGNTLHGGCAVFLIDICSSIALAVLGQVQNKPSLAVSQALVTTFHAPAPVGSRIEIVNETVAVGARTLSAVAQIWDLTNKRLCVTGVHNKMAPSAPGTAKL